MEVSSSLNKSTKLWIDLRVIFLYFKFVCFHSYHFIQLKTNILSSRKHEFVISNGWTMFQKKIGMCTFVFHGHHHNSSELYDLFFVCCPLVFLTLFCPLISSLTIFKFLQIHSTLKDTTLLVSMYHTCLECRRSWVNHQPIHTKDFKIGVKILCLSEVTYLSVGCCFLS